MMFEIVRYGIIDVMFDHLMGAFRLKKEHGSLGECHGIWIGVWNSEGVSHGSNQLWLLKVIQKEKRKGRLFYVCTAFSFCMSHHDLPKMPKMPKMPMMPMMPMMGIDPVHLCTECMTRYGSLRCMTLVMRGSFDFDRW